VGLAEGVGLGLPLGEPLGLPLGEPLGLPLGEPLGLPLGEPLGLPLGEPLGLLLGEPLGLPLGELLGLPLGELLGLPLGELLGLPLGEALGLPVGDDAGPEGPLVRTGVEVEVDPGVGALTLESTEVAPGLALGLALGSGEKMPAKSVDPTQPPRIQLLTRKNPAPAERRPFKAINVTPLHLS
jgi:hypothetical protein